MKGITLEEAVEQTSNVFVELLMFDETAGLPWKDVKAAAELYLDSNVQPIISEAITEYNKRVTELLLTYNLEHSVHGKICEDLSELRNSFLKLIPQVRQ